MRNAQSPTFGREYSRESPNSEMEEASCDYEQKKEERKRERGAQLKASVHTSIL